MNLIATTLIVIATILQLIDFWSTRKVLSHPGGYEDNKFAAWFIKTLGLLPGLIVLKGVPIVGFWVIWWLGGWNSVPMLVGLAVLDVYYASVMVKNVDWIRRQAAAGASPIN